MDEQNENKFYAKIIIGAIIFIFILIVTCMVGCPKYSVYQQEMQGKAELAKATFNRQVSVQEAHAKKESATDLAQADIIRAEGVAKANKIIGASLQHNEAYLHWLWIDQMEKNPNAVYYVPTERSLPLMLKNEKTKSDTSGN